MTQVINNDRKPSTITVPDGYNGHTVDLCTMVVKQDEHCVQLRVKNAPYLVRWMYKADYQKALGLAP
jgi:hypothetical protein